MSAESAQRLKAQAAESGLHQSDSGLASESRRLLATNVFVHIQLQVECAVHAVYTERYSLHNKVPLSCHVSVLGLYQYLKRTGA